MDLEKELVSQTTSEVKSQISNIMMKLEKLVIECKNVSSTDNSNNKLTTVNISRAEKSPCAISLPSTSAAVQSTAFELIEPNPEKGKKRRVRLRTKKRGEKEVRTDIKDDSFVIVDRPEIVSKSNIKENSSVKIKVDNLNETKPKIIDLVMTQETKLVYQLLLMNDNERQAFLIKQSKERRILKRDVLNNALCFNNCLSDRSFLVQNGLSKQIQRQQHAILRINNWLPVVPVEQFPQRNRTTSENSSFKEQRKMPKGSVKPDTRPPTTNNRPPTTNNRTDVKLSFAEQVNLLLYGEELDNESTTKILLKNLNEDKDLKFDSEENQENLEQFTLQLVENNLGYIFEGEVRVNQKHNSEAYVTNSKEARDVCISSLALRQCALHGDKVKVFAINLKPNEATVDKIDDLNKDVIVEEIIQIEEQNEDIEDVTTLPDILAEKVVTPRCHGFVIKIIEKNHSRQFIGTATGYKNDFLLVAPRDVRLPMVKVHSDNCPKNLEQLLKGSFISEVLFLVEIIDASQNGLFGKVVKLVGRSGDLTSENNAILLQNGLDPKPYSKKILKTLPEYPYKIPDVELAYREDFRNVCVFSIDPPTARDLDDAVSFRELANGNLEIGVHISDLTHFVEENSALDEIVKTKTTSIYMVDQVYHMLPDVLCQICSLLPGEDKLTFSVIWEMTKDGKIIKTRFAKTIINSCCQLAYNHAQMIIDNPNEDYTDEYFPKIYNEFNSCDIISIIKQLNSIAILLREKRFESGALRIDQAKIKFNLEPRSGKPISYFSDEQKDSNRLIEDFMLLANQSVAKFIYEKFPDKAILRNHNEPLQNLLKNLSLKLETYNVKFDTSSSMAIRKSLNKIISESKNSEATACIMNLIVAKQMTRARYFCSENISTEKELWHYALSIPIYTHFTSPIRRYPDILVHRLLCAGLKLTPPPIRPVTELHEIMATCNKHKFNAKNAGDDSINLYFIHYLKLVGSLELKAAVLDIQEHLMDVVIIETGHLIKISYKNLKSTWEIQYVQNSTPPEIIVKSKANTKTKPFSLKMFSECLVEVSVKNEKLFGTLLPLVFSN